MLWIRPSGSNVKVIPFCGYEQMDECRWCFAQRNMKALCDILMKSSAILGFIGFIMCSKHNTSGERCNCEFKNLCGETKCKHHSMHLHFIYNHCPSWGLGIDRVWIFLTHWTWEFDTIGIFWLWVFHFSKWLKLVPLLDCNSECVTYAF